VTNNLDPWAYRPFSADIAGWHFGSAWGVIKNLPDAQSDKLLWLKYGDMYGQAGIPKLWGINSAGDLNELLWDTGFSAGADGGWAAWNPLRPDLGVMSFKDGPDAGGVQRSGAELMLLSMSGGGILYSPLVTPLPTPTAGLSDAQVQTIIAALEKQFTAKTDLTPVLTAIQALDAQDDNYQAAVLKAVQDAAASIPGATVKAQGAALSNG
jgi:hypothetical protein